MITFKEKVKSDINDWEKDISKAKSHADNQGTVEKIRIKQKIYNIQADLENLKASLRIYIQNQKNGSPQSKPMVEASHSKVKSEMKHLKNELELEKEESFADICSKSYDEIKKDLESFYTEAKALAVKNKEHSKEKIQTGLQNIEQKIDALDIKIKNSWDSMSDSVKETSKSTLESLKKKKSEMKEWCKEKKSEWF